jgi:membrane protease YdiL (CAAX protease family)
VVDPPRGSWYHGHGPPTTVPMNNPPSTVAAEAPRESLFRRVRWRWFDVVVAFAPIVAFRVGLAFFTPDRLPVILPRAWSVLTVLGVGWMLGYPLLVARLRGGPVPRPRQPRRLAIEALVAVPLLALVWVVLIAGLVAWELIAGAPRVPPNPLQPVLRSPDTVRKYFFLVLAVTVGPAAEEVLFRGLVYNALRQWMPAALAAVLQALAFGFLHPYGIVHAVLATALGLAFVAAYEWRKTLAAPIFLHMLQNAAAVVAVAMAVSDAPFLGVDGEPAAEGCRVTIVVPGSGADAAGLRIGDVITAIDGRPVSDIRDVAAVVSQRKVGDTVVVQFIRDGERREATAELRKRE